MTKLMIIKEAAGTSIIYGLLSVFFETKKYDFIYKTELLKLLQDMTPELVLIDIKRSVDGNDLMSMVSTLDEFFRLRVFFIKIFAFRKAFRIPFTNKYILNFRIFSSLR